VAEGTLDRLGHRLLDSGQEQDAHAYDSLGEAYLKIGQKDKETK
jgi:hypothetical protein